MQKMTCCLEIFFYKPYECIEQGFSSYFNIFKASVISSEAPYLAPLWVYQYKDLAEKACNG